MQLNRNLYWLKWSGYLGTITILGIVVFDIILVTVPLPVESFNIQNVSELLSPWRIVIGFYGTLLFPFTLIGLLHIYLALKPAGRWYSLPPVVIGAVAYLWGAVFHGSLAYQLVILQSVQVSQELSATLDSLFIPLRVGFTVLIFISSIWLFVSLWKGKHLYPKWMKWASPIVFILIFRILTYFTPPIIVGILIPAGSNLGMAGYLAFSTWWFSRKAYVDTPT